MAEFYSYYEYHAAELQNHFPNDVTNVQGLSAHFERYKDTALALEGGYQNIEDDPGNYNSHGELVGTNNGISAPVAELWFGYVPTVFDMKSITKTIAGEIYKNLYWDKMLASSIISQEVAEQVVDHAINAGVYGATKMLQRALNNEFRTKLKIDGIMGLKTLAAINTAEQSELFQVISRYRLSYYKSLNNPNWYPIWRNRVYAIADKFGIVLKKKQR